MKINFYEPPLYNLILIILLSETTYLCVLVDYLVILKKTNLVDLNFNNFLKMHELNSEENQIVLNQKEEVISFKCELQENLQKAMKEFVEEHPNWDQYRILQAAIAGFLMQKGFQNRNLTRLYIGNMFSMNFKD